MNKRRYERLVIGAMAALAVGLSACSPAGLVATSPPISTPTTAASSSPSTQRTPSPATSPSGVQVIADGLYVTKPMRVADIAARINADTKLTAAQKADVIGNAFNVTQHKTFAVSLKFEGRRYEQGQSVDGGPIEIGTEGPYAFPDAHTLVTQEDCCPGVTTFRVTTTPNGFTLRRIGGTPTDEEGAITGKILFESSPFTLQP